jgi:hypothetical protein
MPVLHARESIHRINEIAAGNGLMDKGAADSFIADLNHLASGSAKPVEPVMKRPKSMEQMQQLLGASGVTVG